MDHVHDPASRDPTVWVPTSRRLAPYAAKAEASRGRLVPEPPCPMRTPFQRDRDRIVHATAFRRLNYKTQVFLYHEGDHYRSRLTHTLEVAQIARAIARLLGLDEDLAEALALAHDLGHPPFGHAGERALNRAMASYGGFDHNAQSLRVVTRLERKYAAFDGLNLTFETLDGLIKHNGPIAAVNEPILVAAVETAGLSPHIDLAQYASAEAQAAALADDIAYNNHDIDDGLRAGLIAIEDLADVPLAGPFVREVLARPGPLESRRRIYEVNRRMITAMIDDAVTTSRRRLAALPNGNPPMAAQAVCKAPGPVVAFSNSLSADLLGLRAFLFKAVYRHERVMRVMRSAETAVIDLFGRYRADPGSLPDGRGAEQAGQDEVARARRISDFIAGMTDRFAISEHRRLFDAPLDLV